jgi:hypothetical protein
VKKIILAATAIAVLAVPVLAPAMASANVPRCAAPVTDPATATFTMTETRGEGGQWVSDFTVTVDPQGNITGGTVDVYGVVNPGDKLDEFHEVVKSGSITKGTNLLTVTVARGFNVIDGYTLTNVPMDGTTSSPKNVYPNPGWTPQVQVTAPMFSASTTTDLNHGQYVKSQGGGSDAAHACAGMPLNSTQGS